MVILTKEQYNKIEDGTIGYVVLTGNEWDEEIGTSSKIIKFKDKLYEIQGCYKFEESFDTDFEFDIIFDTRKC